MLVFKQLFTFFKACFSIVVRVTSKSVRLRVIMLNVVMLSVIMLDVIMLSVMV